LFAHFELVPEPIGHGLQHAAGRADDFGPDAIPW
jgi:hypothetical protein